MDYIGVVLIGLGIVLLAYELLTPGFAVFGIGGVVALVFGMMLVDKEPWVEVIGDVAKGVVLGIVAVLSIIFVLVRRVLKKPTVVGKEVLIGKVGVATTNLSPKGFVKLRGERWTAVCRGRIRKGEKVVVKEVKGITLVVKRHRKKSS